MDLLKKNKYLFFLIEWKYISTDKNKKVLKKYAELQDGIENEIETTNGGKKFEYAKDFMKVKLDSDDDLPLNKLLKFPTMTVIVRSFPEKMVNFIHKFILMSVCMNHKDYTA